MERVNVKQAHIRELTPVENVRVVLAQLRKNLLQVVSVCAMMALVSNLITPTQVFKGLSWSNYHLK
jgi:hypothetical protein